MMNSQECHVTRKVIFNESYGQIQRTLYMVVHNPRNCPVTIVLPGNHNLFRLFQVINDRVLRDTVGLIYLEPYPAKRAKVKGVNKAFTLLSDIVGEKRYLKKLFDKHFAELEGCEVFFSGGGWHCWVFYLLKRLGKRNRLVYVNLKPPYITPARQYTPTNIAELGRLIVAKLIYGRYIAMGRLPYLKGILCRSYEFIKKEIDKIISWEEMNEMMKGFYVNQFKIFDVGSYSVIYFDQPLVHSSHYITDRDAFKRELTQIFQMLAKYFPEKEIARKYHPRHPVDKTMIKIGHVLPDFIPAEFLYNDNVKMYLGVCSGSIVNVEKGLAVSILDLISSMSDERKNQLKERLLQRSKSEILFPKSLDEFEKILIDLKRKR